MVHVSPLMNQLDTLSQVHNLLICPQLFPNVLFFFSVPESNPGYHMTCIRHASSVTSVRQHSEAICWLCSGQVSSVAQSCLTLFNPMNRSTPGLPVHHQLPEFTQTHVHRVSDATQPSHPRSSPSPPAPHPSQHQSLFQWVNSSHEVAKVLEFQL